MNTIELTIEGMHCGGCASRIGKLLGKAEGIRDCDVSFDTGKGRVDYSPNLTDEGQIVAVIERAGFTVVRD